MQLKTDFSEGQVLYAGTTSDNDKLNGITNTINEGMVPIGSTFHITPFSSGTITSISANKLIDTANSFDSSFLNTCVKLANYYDASVLTLYPPNTSYVVIKTYNFYTNNTKGIKIYRVCNSIRRDPSYGLFYVYLKFHYTDGSTGNSNVNTHNDVTNKSSTYINPYPYKLIWKTEIFAKNHDSSGGGTVNSGIFYINEFAKITGVDSSSTLSLDRDLFFFSGAEYIALAINNTNYELCDGGPVTNSSSILYGISKPFAENNYIKVK